MRLGIMSSAILAVLLILCRPVDAQVPTGVISGRVSDQTGAAIPSAHVVISNEENGLQRSVETTLQGEYAVPALQAGSYEVAAEAPGFERLGRAAIVQAGSTTAVDLSLRIGPSSE